MDRIVQPKSSNFDENFQWNTETPQKQDHLLGGSEASGTKGMTWCICQVASNSPSNHSDDIPTMLQFNSNTKNFQPWPSGLWWLMIDTAIHPREGLGSIPRQGFLYLHPNLTPESLPPPTPPTNFTPSSSIPQPYKHLEYQATSCVMHHPWCPVQEDSCRCITWAPKSKLFWEVWAFPLWHHLLARVLMVNKVELWMEELEMRMQPWLKAYS